MKKTWCLPFSLDIGIHNVIQWIFRGSRIGNCYPPVAFVYLSEKNYPLVPINMNINTYWTEGCNAFECSTTLFSSTNIRLLDGFSQMKIFEPQKKSDPRTKKRPLMLRCIIQGLYRVNLSAQEDYIVIWG